MNRQECVSVYLRAGCLSQSCNVMLCCAAVTGTVLITVFFYCFNNSELLGGAYVYATTTFAWHNCSLLYQYFICIPHAFLISYVSESKLDSGMRRSNSL